MSPPRVRLAMIVGLTGLVLTSLIMAPMLLSTFPSFLNGFGGFTTDCAAAASRESGLSKTAEQDIPSDYLALYKKDGAKVGVQWAVLAAVGKRETDHGRSNLPGVKSGTNYAGAAGPMQFLVGTWGGKAEIKMPSKVNGYASDGDGDGWADIYNPADAILGAAKMLKRNGAPDDLRRALFTYNRAIWYVDQVLAIAKGYAADGSLDTPPEANPACDSPYVDAAPNQVVREILQYALAQRGKPYRWGGTGPDAFDCSGIVYMAYRSAGLTIPRTTFGQWPFGEQVPQGDERPGDLVFFNAGPGTSAEHPGHVGLIVSPGKMVEARCTLCGPIKMSSYSDRAGVVGFTRPLSNPDVREQLRRLGLT